MIDGLKSQFFVFIFMYQFVPISKCTRVTHLLPMLALKNVA